jgi:hypothetical protein
MRAENSITANFTTNAAYESIEFDMTGAEFV